MATGESGAGTNEPVAGADASADNGEKEEEEKTAFTFDELDDTAKDKARDAWRERDNDDGWWDAVYEDACTIGKLIGIEIEQETHKSMGGGTLRSTGAAVDLGATRAISSCGSRARRTRRPRPPFSCPGRSACSKNSGPTRKGDMPRGRPS